MTRLTDEQRIALARAAFGRRIAAAQISRPVAPATIPQQVAATPQPTQQQQQAQQRPVIRLNLKGCKVDGSDNFKRTIYGYLKLLNQSDEGVKVWNEAGGLRWISECEEWWAGGFASEGSIETKTGLGGYGIFCHELRHIWQSATGNHAEVGIAAERDANLWASARCLEAGQLIGALTTGFMAVDPLTNLFYMLHYSEN